MAGDMQVLLGTTLLVLNVVLIYSIHILPVLVQRLNRAERLGTAVLRTVADHRSENDKSLINN